ncbi:MAG: glutamate racemase [Clostridia bacterium]|nr:glutamate racemase [Clostridia bacterium]MBR4723115.1 glutamate racemase [Clostridia bacterium]
MKIGFFDSGLGGLSVLNHAMREMPGTEFLYYADLDNVPYGSRPAEEIITFARKAVKSLREEGAEAIVIACNTATSAAIKTLREENDIPIVGMEPAVKPAVAIAGDKRVLVCATPFTLREKKLHDLLQKYDTNNITDLLPLPKLVNFAEKNMFDAPEMKEYLAGEFGKINPADYSVFVLGCTHFNFFKDTICEFFPKGMRFIDGIEGTIRHLKELIPTEEFHSEGMTAIKFYFSGREVTDRETLKRIESDFGRLQEMVEIKEV